MTTLYPTRASVLRECDQFNLGNCSVEQKSPPVTDDSKQKEDAR